MGVWSAGRGLPGDGLDRSETDGEGESEREGDGPKIGGEAGLGHGNAPFAGRWKLGYAPDCCGRFSVRGLMRMQRCNAGSAASCDNSERA